MTIQEIKEVAEIVANMLKQDAPDASDVQKEINYRKQEVENVKRKDEIRLNTKENKVEIYYNGKIIHSKEFTCLSDAVFYMNKEARNYDRD